MSAPAEVLLEEMQLFRQLHNDPRFTRWVGRERAQAIKYLTNAVDQTAILRAQGRMQLLEQMMKEVPTLPGAR